MTTYCKQMRRSARGQLGFSSSEELKNLFDTEGYVCIPEASSEINTKDLMEEILETMSMKRVGTWEKKLRMQTLMQESPQALLSLEIIKYYAEVIIDSRYADPDHRRLREFASLTSFPGCKAQCWHRDSTEKTAILITGFMNLYNTRIENGALQVIKQTHKNIKWLEKINDKNISTLILPPKSLTFIDSRLIHRGGSNTTENEIRPVIYASFGQGNLKEPGYFMDKTLANKHSLEMQSELTD